jgi:hypothetical protein
VTEQYLNVDRKHKLSISPAVWLRIAFLLLPLAGIGYVLYVLRCLDGCGPYQNTTSVVDLDNDGDLDVVLSNLRHESETIIWAGPTLWINQGGGKFTSRRVDMGGPSTAAGDIDGDGDADILHMEYGAALHLYQDGIQGGEPSEFRRSRSVTPHQNQHNWSTRGAVVLGDLNNDNRLDVLVSYCCAMMIDKQASKSDLLPFLPWVWINTGGLNGVLLGDSVNLSSIGDLPMRPTLGDLDGDGDLDMYAAILPPKGENYDTADRVLLNDGSGSFVDSGQRLENPSTTGTAASAGVALGDLDGDGDLDALVGKAAGALVWTNQGGDQGGQMGIFAASEQRLGRNPIEAAFLADLDADGDLDALVAGKNQAVIWWNDGQAGFSDSGQRMRFTERHGLAVADFNGDGYLDFFSAAYDNDYHLWLNQGDGRLEETN